MRRNSRVAGQASLIRDFPIGSLSASLTRAQAASKPDWTQLRSEKALIYARMRADNDQARFWRYDQSTVTTRRKVDADQCLAREIDVSDADPAIAAGDSAFIEFVAACEKLVQGPGGPIETRDAIAALTKDLASRWTMSDPNFRRLQPGAPYSSYQLYLNAAADLSIVVDIFAPGQIAPIHNHCCWGVFVCLEGEELERRYAVQEDLSGRPIETEVVRNGPGEISVASPARNAFHQVECLGDVPATSLHIYGADIKALKRNRWDEETGRFVSFQSGADPNRRQAQNYLTPAGLSCALA